MRRLVCLLVFLMVSHGGLFSQNNAGPTFNSKDFNEKIRTAEWLYRYDVIAWRTTDSIEKQDGAQRKRLGKDWFCFQDPAGTWHAVYGKFENGSYDLVFHYLIDTNLVIKRTSDTIDQSTLCSYSRALNFAGDMFHFMRDANGMGFNQFIRRNRDNSFTVWFFPALRSDGVAFYCGDFVYHINSTGDRLIKDESDYKRECKGFKLNKPGEVWIADTSFESPSLTSVFFVIFYKKYFTRLKIENKNFITTAFKDDSNKYSWATFEKNR